MIVYATYRIASIRAQLVLALIDASEVHQHFALSYDALREKYVIDEYVLIKISCLFQNLSVNYSRAICNLHSDLKVFFRNFKYETVKFWLSRSVVNNWLCTALKK